MASQTTAYTSGHLLINTMISKTLGNVVFKTVRKEHSR